MTITVSAKGQLVIPAALRKRYHIKPRTRVEVLDTGGEIVLIPVPDKPFQASRGTLRGISTKQLLAERKKEREKEHAS